MLVLADADGFGIDFDEFSQRVLQAAGDGDGSANGEVEVGKLLPGEIRGGIDASSGLADGDGEYIVEFFFLEKIPDEGQGFARGGAVADGYGAAIVDSAEAAQRDFCRLRIAFTGVGID